MSCPRRTSSRVQDLRLSEPLRCVHGALKVFPSLESLSHPCASRAVGTPLQTSRSLSVQNVIRSRFPLLLVNQQGDPLGPRQVDLSMANRLRDSLQVREVTGISQSL